jgi:hypothetical protein
LNSEEEDPTTQELWQKQLKREAEERQGAEGADAEEVAEHERRAEKAAYLRERLEQRARAERDKRR